MGDIGHLHHVGHVVRDIDAAVGLYRRMGFLLPPPAFPVLPPAPGEPPRTLGAGNTHITLHRNFVELVTVTDEPPEGSTLVPLEVPPAALERLTAVGAATSARLATALARFEGMHILVFGTTDADAAAARLGAAGVPHEGVQRLHRPTGDGAAPVPVGFLELDPAAPEGRLAVAESVAGEERPEHPNGALDLVEAFLCVPDDELAEHVRRYERYLACHASVDGPVRTFALDRGRVTLVTASGLVDVLPGERPPTLPGFAGFVVTVRRLDTARRLLDDAGFPLRETRTGDLVVPAAAALGAAVVFRQA